jgi:hypothetical protein
VSLPIPAEDLARELNRHPAPSPDGAELTIIDPTLVGSADNNDLALRVYVNATAHGRAESWQLTIPLDPIDLDPKVNPSAFVLIVRANIDEWWAVKDNEPTVAGRGQRPD